MYLEPTLVAVFLTGLLGGVHCAGMCGGIVGALAMLERHGGPSTGGRHDSAVADERERLRWVGGSGDARGGGRKIGPLVPTAAAPLRFVSDARVPVARTTSGSVLVPGSMSASTPPRARFAVATLSPFRFRASVPPRRATSQLAYNAGRLSSYTLLGAAAGTAGSFGWLYGEALPLQQAAFAATNGLLVLMGLYVAGVRRVGHALERLGGGLWRRVRPLATASLARASSAGGTILAGALWGLVPCGMVYAVLAGALLSGSAADGAALMLAFGLGTLPNLLLLGFSAGALGRFLRAPRVRIAAGALIAAFGVLGLLRLDAARHIPLLGELCVRLPPVGGT